MKEAEALKKNLVDIIIEETEDYEGNKKCKEQYKVRVFKGNFNQNLATGYSTGCGIFNGIVEISMQFGLPFYFFFNQYSPAAYNTAQKHIIQPSKVHYSPVKSSKTQ